jgi:hypothetical protein
LFFYVDESGHTGTNLFDSEQPVLYYGVLSSRLNLDVFAEPFLAKLRKQLGVKRLHAAELGNGTLAQTVPSLIKVQKKYNVRFGLYRVVKADYALMCFFDQTFDQGLNPAVTWMGYWTPMRYVLLLKVAALFDEETLKMTWEARIDLNDKRAGATFVKVCKKIRSRIDVLPDARSRQIIGDALQWAENHPAKIDYNIKQKSDLPQITPNIIGFQSVMHGIAARLREYGKEATEVIVDRQSQFNKEQGALSKRFALMRDLPLVSGPGLPDLNFSNMPDISIKFKTSTNNAGLELVDAYLWVFKRFMEKKKLVPELLPLIKSQFYQGLTDEISLNAIASRWQQWFDELPELTEENIGIAQGIIAIDEERRLRAIQGDV